MTKRLKELERKKDRLERKIADLRAEFIADMMADRIQRSIKFYESLLAKPEPDPEPDGTWIELVGEAVREIGVPEVGPIRDTYTRMQGFLDDLAGSLPMARGIRITQYSDGRGPICFFQAAYGEIRLHDLGAATVPGAEFLSHVRCATSSNRRIRAHPGGRSEPARVAKNPCQDRRAGID